MRFKSFGVLIVLFSCLFPCTPSNKYSMNAANWMEILSLKATVLSGAWYFFARFLNQAFHFKEIRPWFARIIHSGHVLRMPHVLRMCKTQLYHVNCEAASMYNFASVRSGTCAVCAAMWYKMYGLCYWNNQLNGYSVSVGFRIRKLEGMEVLGLVFTVLENNFRLIIWMSCIVLNQKK